MTAKLPYMPFYGFDYETDQKVKRLKDAHHGIYFRLLWEQWKEGTVPAQAVEAAEILHTTDVAAVRYVLETFFIALPDQPGRCANLRLQVIRRTTEAAQNARVLGGKRRWDKDVQADLELGSSSPQADQMVTRTITRTITKKEIQADAHQPASAGNGHPKKPARVDGWNVRAAEHIRATCYLPDGQPPRGHDIAQDLKWWGHCLDHGKDEFTILDALRGASRLIPDLKGRKWSPAKLFSKRGNWASLFERAITQEGKTHRPTAIGEILARATQRAGGTT